MRVDKILSRCIKKRGRLTTQCYIRQGAKNDSGYGVQKVEGRFWYVHRYMYTVMIGEIPEGRTLDHKCRNILCCNPKHLVPVTPSENSRDASIRKWKKQRKLGGMVV